MPIVSSISKQEVEAQHDAISKLQEKCKLHGVFRGKEVKKIFIYKICVDANWRNSRTEDGPAMAAVATFDDNGNKYAIYAPEYLNESQKNSIFELLLRNVEKKDKIAVFSKDSYEVVKKYCYDKPVNVKLYV